MATQSNAEHPSAVSKSPKSPKSDTIKVPKKVYILLRGMNGEVTRINLNVYDDDSSADEKPVWVTLTVHRLIELLSECQHSNKKHEKLQRDSQDSTGDGLSDRDVDKKFDVATPLQLLEILKLYENGVMSAVMKNALARTCVHFFVDDGSEADVFQGDEDNAKYRLVVFDDEGKVADFRVIGEAEKNGLITDFLVKPETRLAAKTDAELASMYIQDCAISAPGHARTHREDHFLLILYHVVDAEAFLEAFHKERVKKNVIHLFHLPAKLGYLALFNCLLSAAGFLSERYFFPLDSDGNTALHVALSYGQLEVAKALISSGVNINADGNNGCTALHLAARSRYTKIVKLLINKKADVHLKCRLNRTAMHLGMGASIFFGDSYVDVEKKIIECLTNAGADVNAIDDNGMTPLNIFLNSVGRKCYSEWGANCFRACDDTTWYLLLYFTQYYSPLLAYVLSIGGKLAEENESGASVLIDLKDSKNPFFLWVHDKFC